MASEFEKARKKHLVETAEKLMAARQDFLALSVEERVKHKQLHPYTDYEYIGKLEYLLEEFVQDAKREVIG